MDSRASAFLTHVLGPEGATALCKAAERSTALGNAILPRAVLSWVRSIPAYEGAIPGVNETFVSFKKSGEEYTGAIGINDQVYNFEGASQEHLASAVIVALGMDGPAIAAGAKNVDLARLGKSVDLLLRAKHASTLRKTAAAQPQHGVQAAPLKPGAVQLPGAPKTTPTAPTKQLAPPKEAEPKPAQAKVFAPKAKVQFPKVKLPSVSMGKSEMPHQCRECGTRMFSSAGTLRGCLCIRALFKSIQVEETPETYQFTFGPELDQDEMSLIMETLGCSRAS